MQKAKIIIVDRDDNPIGLKERGTLEPGDLYRVSALWVTNSKGEVLLAQRSWNKQNDPGRWAPAVAGTVDEGESYEDNIYKEAAEEIGLKGVTFKVGRKQYIDDGKHRLWCQWYTATVDRAIEDFIIQEDEVEAIKWMGVEAIKKDIADHPELYTTSAFIWQEQFLT